MNNMQMFFKERVKIFYFPSFLPFFFFFLNNDDNYRNYSQAKFHMCNSSVEKCPKRSTGVVYNTYYVDKVKEYLPHTK
uniref:Uncharacterized protein n=1 Tax=Lepeophtheirus salmonis TaxID=72036 RepID=A0A0K2U9Z1_LEPSM